MNPVSNNRWVKTDKILEYVPVLSTAVGLVDLIQKAMFRCFPKAAEKEGYHKYIKDKSLGDCVLILIPFIGNLAVYLRHSRKQQATEQPQQATEQPQQQLTQSPKKFLPEDVALPLPSVLGKIEAGKGEFPDVFQALTSQKQKEVCKQFYDKIKTCSARQSIKFRGPSQEEIFVQKKSKELQFIAQKYQDATLKYQWIVVIYPDGKTEFKVFENRKRDEGNNYQLVMTVPTTGFAQSTVAFLVNKCDTMILPMLEAAGNEQAFKSKVVQEISRALDQIGSADVLGLHAITKALLSSAGEPKKEEEEQGTTPEGPEAPDANITIGTIINPQLASGDTQFQIQAVRKDGKIEIFCRKQAPGIDKQYLFKKDIGEASITFEIYNNGVLTQQHLFSHDLEAEVKGMDELWNDWHMVRDLMTSPYSMFVEHSPGKELAFDLHGKQISERQVTQLDRLIPKTKLKSPATQ